MFHSISKENEERNLTPMSTKGVKFVTVMAACLSVFEYRPAKGTTSLKRDPETILDGATPKIDSTGSTESRRSH